LRVPFVAGNWKMHKDLAAAKALAAGVRAALAHAPVVPPGANAHAQHPPLAGKVEVALCPAFPFLGAVVEALAGCAIAVGAQNAWHEPEGAFTGEVSCDMVRSTGAMHVILGHSERRRLFREDDGTINLKLRAALGAGLRPILCVGETLAEREAGRTMAVVSQQLALGLDGLSSRELGPLTIAYEPVWAIGTGKNATPAQAQEVHAFVRGFVRDRFTPDVAAALRIQYGGSVKAKNAAELMAEPDVDGALVGGASLDAAEFAAIVTAAAKKTT
jgi:triosephosphate isomerase